MSSYSSVNEAAKAVEISAPTISHALTTEHATGGGFVWSYEETTYSKKEMNRKFDPPNPMSRAVIQMEMDGTLITTYPSARAGALDNGADPSSVTKACKGKVKSAGGYTWAYVDDTEVRSRLTDEDIHTIQAVEVNCVADLMELAEQYGKSVDSIRRVINKAPSD